VVPKGEGFYLRAVVLDEYLRHEQKVAHIGLQNVTDRAPKAQLSSTYTIRKLPII